MGRDKGGVESGEFLSEEGGKDRKAGLSPSP